MSYVKTIVCLANSRKPPAGRCVAGREFQVGRFGGWVRAISARPTHEVSEEERRYATGGDAHVMDLITIGFERPDPHDHQQENQVIAARSRWSKAGRLSWAALQEGVEELSGPLWINGSSSVHAENDRVPVEAAAAMKRSLYLIRPEVLRLAVAVEGGDLHPARRRLRASFRLAGFRYCLSVTDPVVEEQSLRWPGPEMPVEEALLCVSLGEPFCGHAYKLAATIITPDRGAANA